MQAKTSYLVFCRHANLQSRDWAWTRRSAKESQVMHIHTWKGDTGCGWLGLESGHLSWKLSLGRKEDKLPLVVSTCFQVRMPPLQRGKAPKSAGVVSAGLSRKGNRNIDLKSQPHPVHALGAAQHDRVTAGAQVWLDGNHPACPGVRNY